jgi:hypothetical protein
MEDSPRVSLSDFERIRALAQAYVLNGGGVVVSGTDEADSGGKIQQIADDYFGGKTAVEWFEAKVEEHVPDLAAQEDIRTAMWPIVHAFEAAAFHFGSAVGIQIVTPRGSTPFPTKARTSALNPRTKATMKLGSPRTKAGAR